MDKEHLLKHSTIALLILVFLGICLIFIVPMQFVVLYLMVVLVIVFLWRILIHRKGIIGAENYQKAGQAVPLSPVKFPSQLECPKCGQKKLYGSYPGPSQWYACENCGYSGPVAFEPKKKGKPHRK